MKKDFLSFIDDNSTKEKQPEPKGNTENAKTNETELKEELNKYANKSEAELMKELFNLAGKNRQEGNLNNTDLDAFSEQISQYLTSEQKARLDMLISQLKK